MLARNRLAYFILVATLAASGTTAPCLTRTSLAQFPEPSTPTVEQLLRRMDAMQSELDRLRGPSDERPAVEGSAESPMRFTGLSTDLASFRDAGCQAQPACDDGGGSCCCQRKGCRGCYSCQCGQCPAPCIRCPRVSTLNPYFNVNIYGALKFDMLLSDARAVSPGTPYYLLPASVAGFEQETADLHARQSSIGAAFTGPRIGNFQAGGMLLAFFYNDNAFADAYGFLPAQAWGELRNQDWRFAAGYQFDVFNPGAPTILPFSILLGSGNTGNAFRGQVRVERFLNPNPDVQWTLQLALSEPITSVIDPAFRISEDNGWPNVEGRIALGLGALQGQGANARRPFEMGLSGVVGQLRNTVVDANNLALNRFVADVWGVGLDLRWQVNEFFGFMGEVYSGEGLGTYNGSALQLINPQNNFQGIESSGGWFEMFVYWNPCLHSHLGYGIDDPRDQDVPLTAALLGRVENSTVFGNVIYDVTQSFRVAFEVSWRETKFRNPLVPDNEGLFFHTQFAWTF